RGDGRHYPRLLRHRPAGVPGALGDAAAAAADVPDRGPRRDGPAAPRARYVLEPAAAPAAAGGRAAGRPGAFAPARRAGGGRAARPGRPAAAVPGAAGGRRPAAAAGRPADGRGARLDHPRPPGGGGERRADAAGLRLGAVPGERAAAVPAGVLGLTKPTDGRPWAFSPSLPARPDLVR